MHLLSTSKKLYTNITISLLMMQLPDFMPRFIAHYSNSDYVLKYYIEVLTKTYSAKQYFNPNLSCKELSNETALSVCFYTYYIYNVFYTSNSSFSICVYSLILPLILDTFIIRKRQTTALNRISHFLPLVFKNEPKNTKCYFLI